MQKIKIHIPEPCTENWDAMTPNTQGRFCGSCQKTVIDFTQQSDYDIAQFLGKPENADACGRFTVEQIGTTYNYYEARKSSNFMRQMAGFAGLLLMAQPMTGCFMGARGGGLTQYEYEQQRLTNVDFNKVSDKTQNTTKKGGKREAKCDYNASNHVKGKMRRR